MEEIIKFLGGSVIVLAAAAWLIRSLVLHLLSKDVESFKQRLQSESNAEVERLRHELRLAAIVHEKQTHLLQERRAEIIAELYKRLIQFLGAAESFTNPLELIGEPSKDAKAKVLSEKAWAFKEYFLHHRIYFSPNVCEKLDKLFDDIHGAAVTYRVTLVHSKEGVFSEKVYDAWIAAWEVMSKRAPVLKDAIDTEFRTLLGVITGDAGQGKSKP